MTKDSVRINPRTGEPISLKMQQSDAIQKVIYEQPGRSAEEILARVIQLFPQLEITKDRVDDHIEWGTDPTKRKEPWLKILAPGRVWPAIKIRPNWQL